MIRRRAGWRAGAIVLVLTLSGVTLPGGHRYAGQPPPGHTGGFEEPTCRRCHSDYPLNDPAGSLDVRGVPASYVEGARYQLVVELRRPGMARSGFQLSARFAAGAHRGRQAGTLTPVDGGTVLADSGAVSYASHTSDASLHDPPDRASWVLEWVAPRNGNGAVLFHAAGNAANDDESELGDFILAGAWLSRDPGQAKGGLP